MFFWAFLEEIFWLFSYLEDVIQKNSFLMGNEV